MNEFAQPATGTINGGSFTRAKFTTVVSLYDRVFSGLIALLVVGGFLFATLFLVWWTRSSVAQSEIIICPKYNTYPELPIKEANLSVIEFDGSDTQAFTEAISLTGASIAELSQAEHLSQDGLGEGSGDGNGFGFGNERSLAPSGVAQPKWNVIQEASDLEAYQRKLDFFGIEIGAVHKSSNEIWRIAQLSTEKVVTKSSRKAESKHWHFVNQRARIRQWDRQAIAQAGIDLQDVIAVHFYPADLIVKMQQLIDARDQEQGSELTEVTFKIVGAPGDFRFEIEDIQFNN